MVVLMQRGVSSCSGLVDLEEQDMSLLGCNVGEVKHPSPVVQEVEQAGLVNEPEPHQSKLHYTIKPASCAS